MTSAAQAKGDSAEREIAALISDLLGYRVRRKLGAGRSDDTGDLEGIPNTTIEVKNYRDIARAVNEGLAELAVEQENAGSLFGALLVRRRGGRWFVAMPVETWATYVRESLPDVDVVVPLRAALPVTEAQQ